MTKTGVKLLVAVCTVIGLGFISLGTIINQAKEIQDLRQANSRYHRLSGVKSVVPKDPERAIIYKVSEEFNTPYNLLLSVRQIESGAYLYELGCRSINPRFKNYPAKLQQYYEASYTISVYMRQYLEYNDEAIDDFIKYLSSKYPDIKDREKWYKAVKSTYHKYKKEEALK